MSNLISVTSDTVVKLLIRRGTDSDRKNITLASGELGYTVDLKRLFVGDGVTQGGNLVGNLNFGKIQGIANIVDLAQPGDLAFQTFTQNGVPDNTLYTLSNNTWQSIHPSYGPAFSYANSFDTSRTGQLDFNPAYLYLSTPSGNLGIGTTSPTSKLSVNGNIDSTGSISTSQNVNVQGNITNQGTITSQGIINAISGMNSTGIISAPRVTIPNAPTDATDSTNKGYVDSKFLPLTGGTVYGGINTQTYAISSINPPYTITELVNLGYLNGVLAALQTGTNATFLPLSGGTMTGSVIMGNNGITVNNTPTVGIQLANKNYVDLQIAAVEAAYLPLVGGTMVGNINMGNSVINANTPTQPTQLANKQYVDGLIATVESTYLPLAGGTMVGNIAMGPNVITASNPTLGPQLANKQYVDSQIISLSGTANNTFLPLSGGTMRGGIDMLTAAVSATNPPYTNTELVNLGYLNKALAAVQSGANGAFLPLLGGTMTGNITMGSNVITANNAPSTSTQLANKAYVDQQDTVNLTTAKAYANASFIPLTGYAAVTGPISASNPTSGPQLANKQYVDTTNTSTLTSAIAFTKTNFVPITGNATVTGYLTINQSTGTQPAIQIVRSTPGISFQVSDTAGGTDGLIVGTNGYVGIGNKGGTAPLNATLTVAGTISSSNAHTGLTFHTNTLTPSQPSELASKSYVDGKVGAATNAGTGTPILSGTSAGTIYIKSLSAGAGITLIDNGTGTISLTSNASGLVPIYTRLQGDGITSSFSLGGGNSVNAAAYRVDIDGVLQEPSVDYTIPVAGNIQFLNTPPYVGAKIVVVSYAVTDTYNTYIQPSTANIIPTNTPTINISFNTDTAVLQANLNIGALSATAGPAFVPPGTVAYFLPPKGASIQTISNLIPAGWLRAVGQSVNQSTYANLYAIIGHTYDTSTVTGQFYLPDFRGQFFRAWSEGAAGIPDTGRVVGTLQGDAIALTATDSQVVNGIYVTTPRTASPNAINGLAAGTQFSTQFGGNASTTVATTTDVDIETRPTNFALIPIIKY